MIKSFLSEETMQNKTIELFLKRLLSEWQNFTFSKIEIKKFLTIIFLISACVCAHAQYYKIHYVAPADWNYFSDANTIIVCTNSSTTATFKISKSDGTVIASNLTTTQGNPYYYRFTGSPTAKAVWPQSTVINGAGLIISADQPISVNVRDIASDQIGGNDAFIKGNASLFSFGDAGIGVSFRLGYYRNTNAADLGYSIMAISDGTVVSANGAVLVTLNAGQSYIVPSTTYNMGTLITATKGSVMTVYKHVDSPGGCGDGTIDQIPPVSVLGMDYVVYRSSGTPIAEQNTVIACYANTVVTNSTYNSTTGALIATSTTTLVNAGEFVTFPNGDGTNFRSTNRITATKNVAVYAGQAQSCEVDVTSIAPLGSPCNGSILSETYKFRDYKLIDLPYFGYVLVKNSTSPVLINGADLETLSGARKQLGSTGYYLINFTSVQISSPSDILVSSTTPFNLSMIQQGGGFSMSSIFSAFVQQPGTPAISYTPAGLCPNFTATLTADSGYSVYQWFADGVAISGATSRTYTATKPGVYTYSVLLACGDNIQSAPVSVILCAVCYNNANTTTAGVDTKHGITLLQRAGTDNGNWPMIRKSAFTALEANTKGFVVTRQTTSQINAISSPQEGMMAYDTDLGCLKLYDGTAWTCFSTPTCP